MNNTQNPYQPEGRLVPVFVAHDGPNASALVSSCTLALAKAAAACGETVLMLDINGGELMERAGIVTGVTLGDVLRNGASISDAKYISSNEHFTAASAGTASLEELLGTLAALSLGYDWVFVATQAGCTPAHVRLASAADTALLGYGCQGDLFMRAYWMLDAIRARAPKFDPLMLVQGNEEQCFETYDLLAATVRDFLGAPPALGGIMETPQDAQSLAPTLLAALRQDVQDQRKRA